MLINRFDVWRVTLDPTQGAEIQKSRPCVVISPNSILGLKTVILAPMTSKGHPYPFRVSCLFNGSSGKILLDQIRSVDKSRLIKKLGVIDVQTQALLSSTLVKMFEA